MILTIIIIIFSESVVEMHRPMAIGYDIFAAVWQRDLCKTASHTPIFVVSLPLPRPNEYDFDVLSVGQTDHYLLYLYLI